MKTTKMILTVVILMVTMIFSTSVNSQTLVRGTDYTVIGSTYDAGSDVFYGSTMVIVNFSEPCNVTAFTGNANYTLYTITTLGSTGKITATSELLSGNALTKSYNKVVSMTLKITATAPAFTITGTKASITISNNPYTAADTLKAYNNGILAGKATCNSTKSEILKSAEVSVYPIPVQDNGNVNIQIDNGNVNTVNLSDLTSGFYLLNIINSNGEKVKTVKILK